jgi:cellulose synthase/poly-beta-1,6-N-acetylglucosamine synthase-like glycosyltransferase
MLNNPVTIHLRESKTVSQLIRREFQRGKSGLYSLIKSSDFAKDLPSIALPMAFLISQFLLIIMPFYSIKAALIPLISIFLFPLPIFFVKKPQCNTMHDFLACYLIAMFYIFARSASLFCELLSLIRCIHFTIML